jgi:hypothetical protein
MTCRSRTFLVSMLLALGLIVQGAGLPAVAAGHATSTASCPTMDGHCSWPGMTHHLMGGACQVTCPAPVALPSQYTAAAGVETTVRFVRMGAQLPIGLMRTPDPFPPKPLHLA